MNVEILFNGEAEYQAQQVALLDQVINCMYSGDISQVNTPQNNPRSNRPTPFLKDSKKTQIFGKKLSKFSSLRKARAPNSSVF